VRQALTKLPFIGWSTTCGIVQSALSWPLIVSVFPLVPQTVNIVVGAGAVFEPMVKLALVNSSWFGQSASAVKPVVFKSAFVFVGLILPS